MIESFLLLALPYIAIAVCVVGTIYRIRCHSLTYSALSSQFLEGKSLMWGSVPWHIGIIGIILGHLVAFLFPGLWQQMLSHKPFLYAVEGIGIAFAFACLIGLLVLTVRRTISSKVQAVTSGMDLVVLFVLIAQVALGIGIAMHSRWGALWSTSTVVPYVWSIVVLQPDISYIQDMPLLVKAHVVGAWFLILLIPFTRLIHMFALPIHYLMRPPQNVIWNSRRRSEAAESAQVEQEARRHFIKGAAGVALGGALLTVGTIDKVFAFFFGPRLSSKEETEMMSLRLKRLEATAAQRKLELERQETEFILISPLSELSGTTGKYFIDYQMRPALAFLGTDGLPVLLSAKCTHLGCTVGNQVNEQGKILCPCHVSFFDVGSGKPDIGAPAKDPLPKIGWVLMNEKGDIICSRNPRGLTIGNTIVNAKNLNVYIAKKHTREETA